MQSARINKNKTIAFMNYITQQIDKMKLSIELNKLIR